MMRFVDCAGCRNWVSAGDGACAGCGAAAADAAPGAALIVGEIQEIAAGVLPLSSVAKVAGAEEGPAPATDIAPAGVLGSVPHGPVWSVIPHVADGVERFRLSGPGVALMLAADQAAGLGIALMRAVRARRVG